MEDVLSLREQNNKRKGQLAGGIMFILLVALLLIPLFWYQNPPPGQEGIQVNLGIPDIGMGEELNAPIASAEETVEETVEEVTEPVNEPEVATPPPPSNPEPSNAPEVITTEDPAAIALQRQKDKEASDRRAEERAKAERQRQEDAAKAAEAEAERQRQKAAAEAEARRRQQAADAANTRNEIGGLFSSGGGGGSTNTAGDGGAADGDPNSTNIGTKSFGSGTIGGGLGSRGVSNSPRVEENSQKAGIVVVSLCVDASGNVIPSSVQFTQRGSSTTDSQLVNAAIRNAKRWGFSSGSVDRQCGSITYNFKVQ